MAKLFANSGDPDQTLCSAASDLGQHCLPVTPLGVSRLQWVNTGYLSFLSTLFNTLEYFVKCDILYLEKWNTGPDNKKTSFKKCRCQENYTKEGGKLHMYTVKWMIQKPVGIGNQCTVIVLKFHILTIVTKQHLMMCLKTATLLSAFSESCFLPGALLKRNKFAKFWHDAIQNLLLYLRSTYTPKVLFYSAVFKISKFPFFCSENGCKLCKNL